MKCTKTVLKKTSSSLESTPCWCCAIIKYYVIRNAETVEYRADFCVQAWCKLLIHVEKQLLFGV
jgi:hypothetical protein